MAEDALWIGAHVREGRWTAVAFDRSGFDHAAVFDSVGDLWFRYEDAAERILVDVPIGLVDETDGLRECDELARNVVGPLSSSVIDPPAREALRKRRYAVANRVNERKTGRELSERAFALRTAIDETDQLLREFPAARDVVTASHSAVCFCAFAGERMRHDRSTAGGYAERLRTLAGVDRDAPAAVQAAAAAVGDHDVSVADVLDATVLAYAALPHEGSLYTLPPDPPLDPTGQPMQIAYRATSSLVESES